jgi:hypothetical protein
VASIHNTLSALWSSLPSDDVYVCSLCGSFFTSQEDFDFHHEQKGHEEAAKLKLLFAAELEGTDKALAFFELSDQPGETGFNTSKK